MSLRRILLGVLFVMLGLAGVGCAAAIVLSSGDRGLEFSAIVGIVTLICGVAVSPLVWLIGKPRFRLAAVVGSGVVIWGWMLEVGLAILEITYWYSSYRLTGAVAIGLGMTALMGIPATVALLLASFRWARVAVWGFVGFAGCGYVLAMLGAALGMGDGRLGEAFLLSALILYGIGAAISLLLVNAGSGDRRHFRWPGVAVGCLAMGFSWAMLWTSDYSRMPWTEDFLVVAIAVTLLPTLTLAHTNLGLMAQMRRALDWVKYVVIVGGWGVGGTMMLGIVVLVVFKPQGGWSG